MGESDTTPSAPREPQLPLQVQPEGMASADALLASPEIRTAKQSKESVRNFEVRRNVIRSYLDERFVELSWGTRGPAQETSVPVHIA